MVGMRKMESMENLPAFSISDLLQMRAQKGATGRMIFRVEDVDAEIFLTRGQLVHARFGDYVGQGAIHLLLQFGTAPCEWQDGVGSEQSSLFKSVESILIDHAFMTDLPQEELCQRFASDCQPKGAADAIIRPLSIVVSGEGFESFRFDLQFSKVIVGRQSELCNLTIPDESVSSEHGVFYVNGGTIHYNDLGSTNGSWVDGRMITEAVLSAGQRLHLGRAALDIVDFSRIRKPAPDETTRLDTLIKLPEKRLDHVSQGLISANVKKKLRSTSKIKIDVSKLSPGE